MIFDLFLKNILNIQKTQLFGAKSHLRMAPQNREEMLRLWDYSKQNPKKAGVLILLYPKEEQTFFVLIHRGFGGVHSSQISFPGGKFEKTDNDLLQTAIRETEEEIGIEQEKIKIIKKISELYVPPSNFLISPFIGFLENEPKFVPQQDEVAEIIEVSLSDFLNINTTFDNVKASYNNYINVPTYNIQGKIIWGATAMILSELKDIFEEII